MSADTVTAISAVVIALAALLLAVFQASLERKHNRLSVMPVLGLGTAWSEGGKAGITFRNVGLGPARIVRSEMWRNGERLGPINKATLDELVEASGLGDVGVHQHPVNAGSTIETGYDQFILAISPYQPKLHDEFIRLISNELRMEVIYESLYGEGMEPASLQPSPPPVDREQA